METAEGSAKRSETGREANQGSGVAADPRAEQLKRDLRNAPTKKELAWREIQLGVDPKYVAVKYEFPVEQMEAAAAEHKRREELKRARQDAACGNS